MSNPFETNTVNVKSLHWFAQHNGAKQFLLWSTDEGELAYFNGSNYPGSVPWTYLQDFDSRRIYNTGFTRSVITGPWQGEQSVCWGGTMYLCNGYDPVICFDGDKISNAGYSTPPGPPTFNAVDARMGISAHAIDFGIGEVGLGIEGGGDEDEHTVGIWAWRISNVNERGQESMVSGPSDTVKINTLDPDDPDNDATRGFAHAIIPVGPDGTVSRRLYRTKNLLATATVSTQINMVSAESAAYFFHSEIPDNVTTTFDDGKPDFALGGQLDMDSLGNIPANVKFMTSFKNTMFYAGMTPNQVRFSMPLLPEVTPEGNSMEIGASAHGPITGMHSTKNALIVFKTHAIYLIKGDPANGFFAQTLTENTGCIAPGSICEVPGVGVVFLARDGVNVLEGALENTGTDTRIVSLSTPIKKYIDNINFSAANNIRAAIYHNDREFWLCVPTIGSIENDIVYVFHYEIGAWSVRPNFPIKCLVEAGDHRGYLFFGSNDTDDMHGVFVYSRGFAGKGSEQILPKWQSNHISPVSEYNVFQPVYIDAYAVSYGNNALQCNYRINGSAIDVRDAPTEKAQQDPADLLQVYGKAKWDDPNALWAYFRPTTYRFGMDTKSKGRVRELVATFAPFGRRIQLVGFAVEEQVGEAQNEKPIDTALKGTR